MISIKNQRNATISVMGEDVPPLAEIRVERSAWQKEFAARKPLRDAVARGFVTVGKEALAEKSVKTKIKEK